jgi:two-component system, OmpR family, response regulator MprA
MPGTVLVAEDDRGLREVLLHVLHEAGYEVVLASSEREALGSLKRLGHECLLLLDARLPNGASEGILRRLADGAQALRCPVVLLTGSPVEIRSPHVVGVLRKPFELTRMLGLVRKFCPRPPTAPPPARGSAPAAA